ncbi:unnamed protein product [Parnassius apollo]|uniref:(apollo) hypothetical protein n=1 Tax=Parnassius apollo TaxID=110799 RepID=A0A8S3XY88_PARAO|nr:unnamed protein product [Parnassius apollo]
MESTKKKYARFRYTQQQLEEALTRITNNDLSINKASKIYDIPKSTLSNKLNNKVPWQRKMGPLTQLTFDEENKLADWILTKAKLGFPMHPEEVYDTVEIFLKQNERENKFTKGRPGKKWLTLFLRRHPEVTKRNAEIISKARAAVTEEAIRNWFTELNKFLEEENALDIKDDPTRIFNSDETGVMTCLKTGLILGPKNYKNTYEIASGKEKESITVLCTFSADGTDVPPFVLYPYKRMPPAVIQNFPDTWYIGRSDSGWMVSVVFFTYIKLFYEWLVKNEIRLPVLLFLDGHKSHINRDMFDFCREKGIMIFCLYPNSTHILQPCDVGIFGPLKKNWKRVVRKHKQASTVPITKQNFAALFKIAYDRSIKPTTIKNSFRVCGLYPMSPDAVDYSRCISNRRQEIAQQNQKGTTTSSLHDQKEDLRSTIKVIEGEVGQMIRNEFVMSYNLNRSHPHQYFELWKKCRNQLENKKQSDTITPNTPIIPLDLSVSSIEASTSNEDDSKLESSQALERNSVPEIVESEITNVETEEMHATNSSIIIDSAIRLPSDNSILLGETSILPNLPPFDTTEDVIDFIIQNEIDIPDVIPLPWYDTLEIIVEKDPIIDAPNKCSSPQNNASSIPAIPSCSNNTNQAKNSLESTVDSQTAIKSVIDPTNSINSSNDTNPSNPLEGFLKIPDLPQKKFKVTKKMPAPYGLTGLKYKEYLKNQDDEKKIKEEELANKRNEREEKRLNKQKSQSKKRVQLKRPKNPLKKQAKKMKVEHDDHTQPAEDFITTDNLEASEETEIETRRTTTTCTEFKDNLFDRYVLVQFESGKRMRHFVGKVIMVNDNERKYKVDFLRKKSVVENVVNFAKPIVPDIAEVDFDDIKRVFGTPNISRRGLICFDDLVFKDIE